MIITLKNAQIKFKLKQRFSGDSFNLICVTIWDTCKEEDTEETGQGKTKLRGRVRVCCQNVQQPFYQKFEVEEHFRVCSNGEFRIFSLL